MKRKTGGLLAAAVLLAVMIAGCSSGNSAAPGEDTEKLKTEISKLQQENAFLKAENERLRTLAATVPVTAEEAGGVKLAGEAGSGNAAASGDGEPAIVKGTPLVVEGIGEYTITSTSFGKKIMPSNPGSFYTYYEAKEPGTTYLAITLKVKNLGGEAVDADAIADVEVKYDNKYEYSTFSALEENGGEDFTYTSISEIEPLKNGTLVFLAEVPDEVETGGKPLYASVKIEGETYRYNIR
ncbi:bZIP transcription factor [Paenibacillus sp. MMS20-IR301]|uniref:bZIP transcription factor n=1 Tax=Paenibacillus sp. MMS20-IR301 TaxID=2895946 RepID=UPI0028E9A6C3|nr:bZIP transcription factor [Paenibacillus sp. MMS20-IR301]WNS41993.1 bZIP transcription factor [Paenibacillus sp. MMS20-IR301]